MITVKQKIMLETFTKLYKKIHTPETVLTIDHCKGLVKLTVDEIYKIYPDKNVGKISINWYDEKFNKPQNIDNDTYCFEINFHDLYTGLPWLICRFYKGVTRVGMYLQQ